MEKFELGQVVRLKPWAELEPLKHNLPSVHEEMWSQCQGEFIINDINEEGLYMFPVNPRISWTIAPWMCEISEAREPEEAQDLEDDQVAAAGLSWEDILNGTR